MPKIFTPNDVKDLTYKRAKNTPPLVSHGYTKAHLPKIITGALPLSNINAQIKHRSSG